MKKNFFTQLFKNTEKKLHHFSEQWLLSDIGIGDVLFCLDNVVWTGADLTTLAKTERVVLKALTKQFPTLKAKQVIDRALKLRVTAEINEHIGLVCCLADRLTPNAIIKLLGKLLFLQHRFYASNLLLVIVSTNVEEKQILIQELVDILEKQEIATYFLKT